jgi:hypothetical protein
MEAAKDEAPLVMYWPRSATVRNNWGDMLNPFLAGFLSGRPVIHLEDAPGWQGPVHSMIGSHLAKARPSFVVWGTGFIESGQGLRTAPAAIAAVRGPLSRRMLLASGQDCPPVFGDPALLYPAMHAATRRDEYDLGIIQHVREAGVDPLPAAIPGLRVRVIDIQAGLAEVADAITSCRRIASSSLHGIIAAHAYGVPAVWISFSDRPLGDGLKFRDYWASVGQEDVQPHCITSVTTMGEIAALRCPIRQLPDISALIKACPFMAEDDMQRVQALMAERFGMAAALGQ